MLTTQQNRLDPSIVDRKELDRLVAAFSRPGHVALIDQQGNRTELPEPIYKHLMRIVHLMLERRAIVMLPEDEAFTTQAGANFLGMSRQFFVNLLEKKEIPFHKVGAHRRIYFKDLLEYQNRRDIFRTKTLDNLAAEVDRAGHYFPKPKEGKANAG
jgi:excisionase family DNA binding protein